MQYIFKHFFELQMVSRFGHYTSTWMFNTDKNYLVDYSTVTE